MPVVVPSLSRFWWDLITRFGESQLLVPTLLLLAAWLAWLGRRRSAMLWLGLVLFTTALTTATKVAFIGWGIGSASLNFTGISGHAMFAAAVLPLLMHCLAASHGARAQAVFVSAGYAAAALVACSRVAIHAHSESEVVIGFLLGGAASALAMHAAPAPRSHLPRGLLAVLLAAYLVNPVALPSMPTHDMVTRFALWVSGHDKPYTRRMMHLARRDPPGTGQPTAGPSAR